MPRQYLHRVERFGEFVAAHGRLHLSVMRIDGDEFDPLFCCSLDPS